MCGIIGYIGKSRALPFILDGLSRLEYRGYDSAGVAIVNKGRLVSEKTPGKLQVLKHALKKKKWDGSIGIGHTRWATHGDPSKKNAHPHFDSERSIALVHNGIVENHLELRQELTRLGHTFRSDTDTEVIPHLIKHYFKGDLLKATLKAVKKLKGSNAFAVISVDTPDKIIAARTGASPLIAGYNRDGAFIASDFPAILPHTRDAFPMRENEVLVAQPGKITVYDTKGRNLHRKSSRIKWNMKTAEKSGYPSFMLKEIHEQPDAVANTFKQYATRRDIFFDDLGISDSRLKKIKRIVFLACGTAWHSGLVGKYAVEEFAGIPASTEIASEFRYGNPNLDSSTLAIAISQSGETADTLAAVKEARSKGALVLGITNVLGSSLTREVHGVIYMYAGPEIGVAASKTYVTQLTSVILFALYLGKIRKCLPRKKLLTTLRDFHKIPRQIETILKAEKKIKKLAQKLRKRKHFMFIGRRYNYPTAFEGALKLKEITYIHAEGYAAGEMKHGPLALVEPSLAVVAIATASSIRQKLISNITEIQARKGTIISIANKDDAHVQSLSVNVIEVPKTSEVLSTILNVVPLQLLAYHIAVLLGKDVDQPRNLAKSVTVE